MDNPNTEFNLNPSELREQQRKSKLNALLNNYSHDYRGMAMSEDGLKIMLTGLLLELWSEEVI